MAKNYKRAIRNRLLKLLGVQPGTGWADSDVGASFDQYTREWSPQRDKMRREDHSKGAQGDESLSHLLKRPGDDWGPQAALHEYYSQIMPRLVEGQFNLLEIGSGAGRLTEVLAQDYGSRITDYHTIDVSTEMTRHLRERMQGIFEVKTHVVKSVDLSMLPDNHFDLCISQSAWSHINFYDQYRYLRDLRRVMKKGAPFLCRGIYFMGIGNNWTWESFLARVQLYEQQAPVFRHEFIGILQLIEMMLRLEWELEAFFGNVFIIRRGAAEGNITKIQTIDPAKLQIPYFASLEDYLAGQPSWTFSLLAMGDQKTY